jgi:spermidine synthase
LNVVEFGILDGFSLRCLEKYTKDAKITAYDIFEDFNGNHAVEERVRRDFADTRVDIRRGDLYDVLPKMEEKSIDVLHVDIANDGDVYEFVLKHSNKVKAGGIILMEGGTKDRDGVDWMVKYDKRKIKPVIDACPFPHATVGTVPSMTIIRV